MWYGSSPQDKWEERCLNDGVNTDFNVNASFCGDEWIFSINSFNSYYLGLRKDFSKPCLPFIPSTGKKVKTYIRGK